MTDLAPDADRRGPSLGELVLALRSTWLPIVAFVLVAAVTGYVIGGRSEVTYESTATVAVADARTQVGVFGTQVPGAAVDRSEAELLARSAAVRLRAAEVLQVPVDSLEPVDTVVSSDRSDPFIELTAHASSRQQAVDLSNAYASALVAERDARLRSVLDDALGVLDDEVQTREQDLLAIEDQIARSGSTDLELEDQRDAASAALSLLRERRTELRVEARTVSGGVSVADPAVSASQAPRPAPSHLSILAGLVAAVLSAAIVYLRLSYDVAKHANAVGRARVIEFGQAEERRASGP